MHPPVTHVGLCRSQQHAFALVSLARGWLSGANTGLVGHHQPHNLVKRLHPLVIGRAHNCRVSSLVDVGAGFGGRLNVLDAPLPMFSATHIMVLACLVGTRLGLLP